MKAKLRLFNNIVRLLILIMLFTGYNKNIIDYVKKQDCVKRFSIHLALDGVRYRVIKYFN